MTGDPKVPSNFRSATAHFLSYALVLAAAWTVSRVTPWGRAHDLAAYRERHRAGRSLHQVDAAVLTSVSVVAAAVIVVVVVLWLAGRRRTARPFVAVGAALLTTETLKAVLPQLTAGGWALGAGSFPSGHTTVAAALSLAAMRAASPRWRRHLVGPATAWTVLVATATITLGWHRPSDVVAGLVVASAWARWVGGSRAAIPRALARRAAGFAASATLRHRAQIWWAAATVVVLLTAAGAPGWEESLTEAGTRSYLAALAVVACACGWVVTGRYVPARATTRRTVSARR